MSDDVGLDLYWIPVGAGARAVRIGSGTFEALAAGWQRRRRASLFHSALVATTDDGSVAVEMTPVPDDRGRTGASSAAGPSARRGSGASGSSATRSVAGPTG